MSNGAPVGQGLLSLRPETASVARPVCHCCPGALPDPGPPASLWDWLARLPDPGTGGARFTLACDRGRDRRAAGRVRFVHRGRGMGGEPPAAGAQGAGLPAGASGPGSMRPVGEDGAAGGQPPPAWTMTWLTTCCAGGTAGLAAACEIFSPAQLQEQRRDAARKAKEKAREARERRPGKAARRDRAARATAQKKGTARPREQARKAAAAAVAASAQAVASGSAEHKAGSAFGRVPVPAGHPVLPARVCGDPRHAPALRGLGADGKASRGAKVNGQEAPQHLGFFWHRTRLNAAQRGVDRKTNETTVIGPVIDEMDLAGVCLTVDALHSLADLNKRVLARGGHVIFVIKGNQPRTYQALNDIGWEQIPVAAATFEADRGRIETRTIQVAPAPEGLKYPDMKQAALIERYTTFTDKQGQDRHPQRDRPDPHHRQPGSGAARGPARPQPRALGRHRGHPLDPRHRPERGLLPGPGSRRSPLHGYCR